MGAKRFSGRELLATLRAVDDRNLSSAATPGAGHRVVSRLGSNYTITTTSRTGHWLSPEVDSA
jgi:hypothetical protein